MVVRIELTKSIFEKAIDSCERRGKWRGEEPGVVQWLENFHSSTSPS